jgi:hypothetical protein
MVTRERTDTNASETMWSAFSLAVPHPDLIALVAEKAREPATELVVSTSIPKTPKISD